LGYALCAMLQGTANFFMDDTLPCYCKTLSNLPKSSILLAPESL
jgi:hypothetical protein